MAQRLLRLLPIAVIVFGGVALSGLVMLIVGLLTGAWGTGQVFQPAILQARLQTGQDVRSVEQALALAPAELCLTPQQGRHGGSAASLSRPGVGSWFVPQFNTAVWFDAEGRLTKCVCKCVYQLDECHVPIPLHATPEQAALATASIPSAPASR